MTIAAKHKSERSESALTPPTQIAYPHVHEKRTKRANGKPLEKPRHDLTLVVRKLHADATQCPNYKWLAAHAMEAATKAWGSFPQGGHWPIQDGDAPPRVAAAIPGQAPAAPKEYPWRKGHWIVEATNYMDPGPRVAILQGGQVVELPARVVMGKTMYKSGDFAQVMLHAYTFHNEKFGVNFGFEGVCWTAEGEAIGNGGPKSTAQMFGGLGTVMAPNVGPAPQPQYTPPLPPGPSGAYPAPGSVHAAAPIPPAAAGYPSSVAPLPPMPAAAPAPGLPPIPGMPPAAAAPVPGMPPIPQR